MNLAVIWPILLGAYELIYIYVNMGQNCSGNSGKIRRHRSKIGRPKFVHPRRGVHVAQNTSKLASKYFSSRAALSGMTPKCPIFCQAFVITSAADKGAVRHQLHFCQAVRSKFHYKKRRTNSKCLNFWSRLNSRICKQQIYGCRYPRMQMFAFPVTAVISDIAPSITRPY